MRTPPFPSLDAARRARGDEGIRALVAWIIEQPTYSDAARALGTRPDALRKAATRAGQPLPDRSSARGAPAGSLADARARAKRGLPPRENA